MKRAINLITVIAFLTIMVGGSMLDSPNICVPMAIMAPGMLWIGARVIITEVYRYGHR